MTRFLLVTAHPEANSFNLALSTEAGRYLESLGHDVQYSNLNQVGWQPVSDRRNFTSIADPNYFKQQVEEAFATEHQGFSSDIQQEIDKLFWCDILVLQFPLWWFGMPAILKGWVDRVFAYEVIYKRDKWYETGSFAGKKAMISLTTGGPEAMYTPPTAKHPTMQTILEPIHHGILRFNGFDVQEPFIAWEVAHINDKRRKAILENYKARLLQLTTR